MTDGRGGVVHPDPTASGVGGGLVQGVGESRIAAREAGDGDGVLFADDVVGAALAISDDVAVGGDLWCPPKLRLSKTVSGRRGRRPM